MIVRIGKSHLIDKQQSSGFNHLYNMQLPEKAK